MAFALIGIGAVVTAIGGFLWWGNMSGNFPTFPYAGYIVMGIGGALGGLGWKKFNAEKEGAEVKQFGR
jgi:hypothetical protein